MLGSVSSAREAERFLTVQSSTELPPSGTIFAPFKTRWRDCRGLISMQSHVLAPAEDQIADRPPPRLLVPWLRGLNAIPPKRVLISAPANRRNSDLSRLIVEYR